jgi:hypothetical protein
MFILRARNGHFASGPRGCAGFPFAAENSGPHRRGDLRLLVIGDEEAP